MTWRNTFCSFRSVWKRSGCGPLKDLDSHFDEMLSKADVINLQCFVVGDNIQINSLIFIKSVPVYSKRSSMRMYCNINSCKENSVHERQENKFELDC